MAAKSLSLDQGMGWGKRWELDTVTILLTKLLVSLTTGLQVVRDRALAMQEACLQTPGAMATVIGMQEDALRAIIESVLEKEEKGDSPEVCVGNSLFPGGAVVSGEVGLVREVGRRAEAKGASVRPVRVSGAFHSKLMIPAVGKLEAALRNVRLDMPTFPVYSNVTGLPYGTVEEIRTGLALQVTHPVLWDSAMLHMIRTHLEGMREDNGVKILEVGPGRQLKGMLKRISRTAYRQCENITV